MPVETLEPAIRLTLPESYGQVISLEWSPDGRALLFSTTHQSRYSLYVVDLTAPEPRRVPRPENGGEVLPNAAYGSWSPDGKTILFRAAADAGGALSRLCVMNADGANARVLWEPENRSLRVHGTAWQRPTQRVAAAAPMPAAPPVVKPEPAPVPMEPVKPVPAPIEPPKPALGEPVKLHGSKVFSIDRSRSPASVRLAAPGNADFVISLPVLPDGNWKPRRQGVGVTLELDDGALYRGTVIYSGVPWATIQGRPKEGKVRLIDGKQLPPNLGSFKTGFRLTMRREGGTFIVAVNDEEVLKRPIFAAAGSLPGAGQGLSVKALHLTLENFDEGAARFPLGNVYYRQAQPAPAVTTPAPAEDP
jgi:hypothetical protein